jgi:glutaredoxin
MDFFGRLNAKNTFGMFTTGKNINIVNLICGVLLIVLIVVLIICLVRKDKFSDKHNKNTEEETNEEVHLFHVVNQGCPFSRKMSELLAKNGNKIAGQQVKDITMDHPLAKKFNVTGTPTIACTKTNKTSVGFKPIEEVEKELMGNGNENENGNGHGNGNGNEITNVIVGRMTCPFCKKLCKFLDDNNIKYQLIESESPNGKGLMNKLGVNGVPVSLKMNGNNIMNHKVGYHEDLSFYK